MSAERYQYALSASKLSFKAYNLPRHLKFNSRSLVFDYLFWMPLASVEPRYAECFNDLPEVKFLNIVSGHASHRRQAQGSWPNEACLLLKVGSTSEVHLIHPSGLHTNSGLAWYTIIEL